MRTNKRIEPKSNTKKKNQKSEQEMNLLLKQAYDILENKSSSWSPTNEELYSLLERVIFLKARENTFRDFFDHMEDVIESISKLDFSKRVPISEISLDKRNLFNYAVMCINIIAEKLESSVVSVKSVNTICSILQDTVAIVTDSNGVIRFINNIGETLFGKRSKYIGKSISILFPEHNKIKVQYEKEGIKNKSVSLVSNFTPRRNLQFYLTIPTPYKDPTEVSEVVYLFSRYKSIESPNSEFLHLGHFLFDILKDIKKDEFYSDLKFDINIDYDVELKTNFLLLRSLFEYIFYYAASKSFRKDSFVQISACNISTNETLIRIHDNGIGMKPSEKKSFFNNTDIAVNTLDKINETIFQLNGVINYYSTPGRGTTFEIRFPR